MYDIIKINIKKVKYYFYQTSQHSTYLHGILRVVGTMEWQISGRSDLSISAFKVSKVAIVSVGEQDV